MGANNGVRNKQGKLSTKGKTKFFLKVSLTDVMLKELFKIVSTSCDTCLTAFGKRLSLINEIAQMSP